MMMMMKVLVIMLMTMMIMFMIVMTMMIIDINKCSVLLISVHSFQMVFQGVVKTILNQDTHVGYVAKSLTEQVI